MWQPMLQICLDVLGIYLVMFLFGKEPIGINRKSILWYAALFSFCFLARVDIVVSGEAVSARDIAFQNYEILPVGSLVGIVGLVCVLFIINSIAFELNHVEVIFTTLFAFITWLIFRFLSIGIVHVFGFQSVFIGIITLLLIAMCYWRFSSIVTRLLSNESSVFTKLTIVNVFILFLVIIASANFEVTALFQNRIHLLLLLFFIGTFMSWLLIEQKNSEAMKNRVRATEQYIPIIDELVLEIRARQHEFSNKLLAISSIVETTDDIKITRAKMQAYVENVSLSNGQYSLLNIDHKVVAGFLYTKMKRAEQSKIELVIEQTIPVQQFPCEDFDLIEVLGILIDNAIEASASGDTIYLSMKKRNEHLELTVSNPAEHMSNKQFMQLFEAGYSTKSKQTYSRGYGLYNVKEIAERYNSRIIARNEQEHIHMITLGIQF